MLLLGYNVAAVVTNNGNRKDMRMETASISSGTVGRLTILHPRGEPAVETPTAVPRLSSLTGKTLGIVVDGPWRSWYVFTDEMQQVLATQEPEVRVVTLELNSLPTQNARQGTKAKPRQSREEVEEELDRFAREVDAVVVGLGT
jgi:hypothetical protein